MRTEYNELGKSIMKRCVDKNINKSRLCSMLNITNRCLNEKLCGFSDFKLNELHKLVECLDLNPSIFFEKNVS